MLQASIRSRSLLCACALLAAACGGDELAPVDADAPDASVPDASVPDASAPDAGVPDPMPRDAGSPDGPSAPDAAVEPDASVPLEDAGTIPDEGPAHLFAEGDRTCVIWTDSTLRCWGENEFEGRSRPPAFAYASPTVVPLATGFTQLSLRWGTCGVRVDGTVACVEADPFDARAWRSTGPTTLEGLTDVVEMYGGISIGSPSCALRSDGGVDCWGTDWHGELGTGVVGSGRLEISSPRRVEGLADITRLSTTDRTVHALRSDGAVLGWGDNYFGVLGDGTEISRSSPVTLELPATAIDIDGPCALLEDRTVACWGSNVAGQVGFGRPGSCEEATEPDCMSAPRRIEGIDHVVQLATGGDHVCAVRDDGTLWCWGQNYYHQLGVSGLPADCRTSSDTPMQCTATPTRVPGLTQVVEVAAGTGHTCALRADRSVWCWGNNWFSSLGIGVSRGELRNPPTRVTF